MKDAMPFNRFVADRLRKLFAVATLVASLVAAGRTVPVQHSGSLGLSAYPPTANEWANGSTISGWSFIGSGVDPEPGWICGHPSFAGPGHVGIVDYDGYGIAAGTLTVNRQYWQFLDGSCGYNKFGE